MDMDYGEEGMPLTDDEGGHGSNVSFDVGLSLLDSPDDGTGFGLGMEFGAVGGPGTNRARQGSGHAVTNGSALSAFPYGSSANSNAGQVSGWGVLTF